MAGHAKAATLLKLTASSLIITTLLAGCKPATLAERPRSAGEHVDVTARLASKLAEEATRAMAMGDHAQAIDLAERVVSAAPDDAGYRTLLAQAYLRAGRFVSADQAFADVIRLMPDNDKARVAQAVARLAQGDRAGAREVLGEVTNAPTDDYGLALALSGDTAKALAVLEPAARGMRGTSRTRQNLALAYALAGQWDKARVVAAQDVSPSDIDRRMESWAKLASPEARDTQVAALLGATRVAGDPGQPEMLALVKPVPTPIVEPLVETAAAQPVPVAPALPAVVALQQPAPAERVVEIRPAPAPAPAPVIAPVAEPVAPVPVMVAERAVVSVPAPVTEVLPVAIATPPAPEVHQAAVEVAITQVASPAPVVAPAPAAVAPVVTATPAASQLTAVIKAEPAIATAAPVQITRTTFEPAPLRKKIEWRGVWVVQLGAYKSEKRAEAGWVHQSDNFKRLAQYSPAHSVYTVSSTGAVFHRLSVTGFVTRTSAVALCRSVKLDGGSCFVRRQGADTPIRMVSRDRERLAANY